MRRTRRAAPMVGSGRRVPNQMPADAYQPGDYGLTEDGWMGRPPSGGAVRPIVPIELHGDKTITAAVDGWRLERGEWSRW
jgi:hypothetical protein